MAGRPRIYDNVEELENAIDTYFNIPEIIETPSKKDPHATMPSGRIVPNPKPTVTGLALHLGFADKTTLYEYRDRAEFSYPIKRALTRIELYHEEGLSENNVTGRIFALKNMGWKDKVETGFTDNEGKDVKPIIQLMPAANCEPLNSE